MPLPVVLAALAIVAGVAYRLWLLRHDAPPTNSDEATMGLAALHIAQGRHLPVWFYGQAYMGTLEAYLAAPLFALAGPSVLALRMPTLALYALFLVLSWRLTRRLGGEPWYALLVVAFLALGSDRVVKNQLIAGGGYPELNPAGVALALLTVGLCAGRSATRSTPGRAGRSRARPASGRASPAPGVIGADPDAGARLPRWAAWGLVSGLMLWVDPLVLPYVLTTGAVLVARRRRELAARAGPVVAGALLLGAAPMLLDSLRHGRNPLAAILDASGGEAATWGERLYGGLVLGPPLGMGFCSPGHCADWQLWWAVAFPALLLLGTAVAWRALRTPIPATPPASPPPGAVAADLGHLPFGRDGKRPRPGQPESGDDERRVSAAVRLALLAGAAAVLLAYTVSSAAGRTPVESARYLSCLAVATPALLWPLWRAARRGIVRGVGQGDTGVESEDVGRARHRAPSGASRAARVGAIAVLAAVLGTATAATADAIGTVPAVQAEADRHRALVDALDGLGVRHVRGGYWTCNRLTFESGENVACAVVDDELRPGLDRWPAYRRVVAADPDAAWVAPVGSPLAATLDRRLDPNRGLLDRPLDPRRGTLDVVAVDGWRIYLPRH
ncbi:hypothetical protein GA0070604_4741 [Micromonospora eburnea]|uniref:4-amino-4-deoxy-L-arabinose transferase n=1 Tax=Micromonospora eburnea TaxID=227316 RepID=A0A1C6V8M4_9ACTN|nr:hypothetical protein GA0070604_4741 [Micromonospora eburnea]